MYILISFTEMARRGYREFHIRDDEILQLLVADNSDAEDEFHLNEDNHLADDHSRF